MSWGSETILYGCSIFQTIVVHNNVPSWRNRNHFKITRYIHCGYTGLIDDNNLFNYWQVCIKKNASISIFCNSQLFMYIFELCVQALERIHILNTVKVIRGQWTYKSLSIISSLYAYMYMHTVAIQYLEFKVHSI